MIAIDFSSIQLRIRHTAGKPQVYDPVRKKWLALTPEEHVRQYLIQHLTAALQYPAALMAVEKKIQVGAMAKRYDVVVYNRDHQPWLLAECKAPKVPITQAALQQLLNYQRTTQCRYWLLTNGHQTYCADGGDIQQIRWLEQLPAYEL